ncbi:RrF2 family transcriptional regulator, partial [Singulisphaera rosea]
DEINIGWLLRQTEPHFHIAECFDPVTNTCPISPACGLKGALSRAQQAFLDVLDEYTLGSFQSQCGRLVPLWAAFRDADPDV